MRAHPVVLAVSLLASPFASAGAAQTHVRTGGPVIHARYDLATGTTTILAGPAELEKTGPNTVLCLDNTLDDDGFYDALLYPAGEELYDWGRKTCGVSRLVDRITIGCTSMAVPVGQGGPGGSLTVRLYEWGQGFGVPGIPLVTIPLTGLPSIPGPIVQPVLLDIELGDLSFRTPDGPIGWSYENQDGLTAPILVDVDPANGTELFYDVYSPAPAKPATYQGTFTLGPGGASNDPKENSFYLKVFEDGTPADVTHIPAPPNPDVMDAPEPPILGFDWRVRFDLSQRPNKGITMVALANSRVSGVPFRYGVLVANLDDLACPVSVSTTDFHRFRVPTHSALSGRQLVVQGAYVNGNGWPKLTNAMHVTIGARMPTPESEARTEAGERERERGETGEGREADPARDRPGPSYSKTRGMRLSRDPR